MSMAGATTSSEPILEASPRTKCDGDDVEALIQEVFRPGELPPASYVVELRSFWEDKKHDAVDWGKLTKGVADLLHDVMQAPWATALPSDGRRRIKTVANETLHCLETGPVVSNASGEAQPIPNQSSAKSESDTLDDIIREQFSDDELPPFAFLKALRSCLPRPQDWERAVGDLVAVLHELVQSQEPVALTAEGRAHVWKRTHEFLRALDHGPAVGGPHAVPNGVASEASTERTPPKPQPMGPPKPKAPPKPKSKAHSHLLPQPKPRAKSPSNSHLNPKPKAQPKPKAEPKPKSPNPPTRKPSNPHLNAIPKAQAKPRSPHPKRGAHSKPKPQPAPPPVQSASGFRGFHAERFRFDRAPEVRPLDTWLRDLPSLDPRERFPSGPIDDMLHHIEEFIARMAAETESGIQRPWPSASNVMACAALRGLPWSVRRGTWLLQ